MKRVTKLHINIEVRDKVAAGCRMRVINDGAGTKQASAVVQEKSAATTNCDVKMAGEVKEQADNSQLPVALSAEGSRGVSVRDAAKFHQDLIVGIVRSCLRCEKSSK